MKASNNSQLLAERSADQPLANGLNISSSPGVENNLVSWENSEDPENPKNWPGLQKWKSILGISAFVFLSPLSSTVVAPAIPAISQELDIQAQAVQQMVVSLFLLGFACGPLCASPLSEIYGRVRVVQSWNLLYLAFNAACGAAQSKEALLVLRFVAGLFGSATLRIGGGTLSDLFYAKDRGKAVAIYSWSPILSPVVGAIAGGFISQHTTWRWNFWACSLLGVLIQAWELFFLQETYPPLILRRKKKRLIERTGNTALYTEFDYLDDAPTRVLSINLVRPFKLLATQPIVQVLALYNAYLYRNIYILYADFVTLWTDVYNEPIQIASLNYISIAIGSAIAAELPEFRTPIMAPATLCLAAGMFWYGWSAQSRLHWIMPNIGCSIFVGGALVCTISVNAYIVDTYGHYSASALAAVSTLRCVAGFTFPIFAPYLYQRLEYGWAGSLLGFIALGVGLPAILMLAKYGKALRERSPYAAAGAK